MSFARMERMIILFTYLYFSYSGADQSLMVLQDSGTDFNPANSVELLTTVSKIRSTLQCYMQCHLNFQCRTFVYKSETQECSLYEGSINTGSVVATASGGTPSIVGGIIYTPELFISYGLACDQCTSSRYLTCVNNKCQCLPNTFWNGTMCLNQVYYGQTCTTYQASCRQADLSLICLSDCLVCAGSPTDSATLCPISLWSFDNNTLDSFSILNGISVNFTSYRTPGINGYGSALSVNQPTDQYVSVPTYRNFSYRSFTVEMWIYCTSLTNVDYGLFGQNCARTTDQSLHLIIRNYILLMGFFGNDLTGSTTIHINNWYHVAFVYDYPSSTQTIYLNGKLDGNRVSSSPFKGTSGVIVIGVTEQSLNYPHYFSGYIDEVLLTMRTKNGSEILDDATLVCWHSFDNGSHDDLGPMRLNGTAINVTSVNGRVNQAVSFTSNSSYYQISGFVLLGVSNNPYSISLWVSPSTVSGAILVHLSTTTTGQGWCVGLMGFSSTGQIIITGWGNTSQELIGPVLPINIWTHVVDTFSTTNGHRLYINGTLISTTGPMIYTASGQVNILTLANRLQGIPSSDGGPCNSLSILPNVYYGSMDEFRVYSRELNATDVHTLANP